MTRFQIKRLIAGRLSLGFLTSGDSEMAHQTEADALECQAHWNDEELLGRISGTKFSEVRQIKKATKSLNNELLNIECKYIKMTCHCGVSYQAKRTDLMRGWGLSCSKRCAAIRREYGRPRAKVALSQ